MPGERLPDGVGKEPKHEVDRHACQDQGNDLLDDEHKSAPSPPPDLEDHVKGRPPDRKEDHIDQNSGVVKVTYKFCKGIVRGRNFGGM
jgi:hypothetical protein